VLQLEQESKAAKPVKSRALRNVDINKLKMISQKRKSLGAAAGDAAAGSETSPNLGIACPSFPFSLIVAGSEGVDVVIDDMEVIKETCKRRRKLHNP
jgi:hypothetical protein